MQPFIIVMQVFALTLMLSSNGLRAMAIVHLTFVMPALLAGTAVGVMLFGKLNDARFRHIVLAVLLVAGFTLVM